MNMSKPLSILQTNNSNMMKVLLWQSEKQVETLSTTSQEAISENMENYQQDLQWSQVLATCRVKRLSTQSLQKFNEESINQ